MYPNYCFLNTKIKNPKFLLMKKHNFNAGPAILPPSVFREASAAVLDFAGGLSILEISHRSTEFTKVLDETTALIRELLNLPESFEVLYLSGGASTQFFMTAMNLLDADARACYIDTGSWSAKAIKEAKAFGRVEVVGSSKEDGYTYIPKDIQIPTDAAYLHITSNNTIFGTQFHQLPETSVPIVADMSSDILSRPIDINRYGLIYAGAQKNLGPAGVTLVVVNKEMLGKVSRTIPSMLDYRIHISKQSTYNTPPVFPIYVMMLNLRWLKENGGLKAVDKRNKEKAAILYSEIDANPLFKGVVTEAADRSLMNVTFRLEREELTADFLKACATAGCVGVKGHRSVGGFRASIYNAMEKSSVEVLIGVMQEFSKQRG